MSKFNTIFGNSAIRQLNTHQKREVERMIKDLIRIGETDDFLSLSPGGTFDIKCHHRRACDIGKRLSEIGGVDLMLAVRQRVQRKLKSVLAEHLDHCWKDIGDWRV